MRGLEELLEGTSNLKKEIVEVGTYVEDEIGKRLHPSFNYRFLTIIGAVGSVRNAMLFIGNDSFDIRWLGRSLTKKELNILYNANTFKSVPNYWEIIKLITVDRILADKELLDMLVKRFPKGLSNYKFMPMRKIKSGIVVNIVPDDKLKKYGGILNNVLNTIINEFNAKLQPEQKVSSLDKDDYKEVKNIIKTKVFEEAVNYSDGSILAEMYSDISNDELKKLYLK